MKNNNIKKIMLCISLSVIITLLGSCYLFTNSYKNVGRLIDVYYESLNGERIEGSYENEFVMDFNATIFEVKNSDFMKLNSAAPVNKIFIANIDESVELNIVFKIECYNGYKFKDIVINGITLNADEFTYEVVDGITTLKYKYKVENKAFFIFEKIHFEKDGITKEGSFNESSRISIYGCAIFPNDYQENEEAYIFNSFCLNDVKYYLSYIYDIDLEFNNLTAVYNDEELHVKYYFEKDIYNKSVVSKIIFNISEGATFGGINNYTVEDGITDNFEIFNNWRLINEKEEVIDETKYLTQEYLNDDIKITIKYTNDFASPYSYNVYEVIAEVCNDCIS